MKNSTNYVDLEEYVEKILKPKKNREKVLKLEKNL